MTFVLDRISLFEMNQNNKSYNIKYYIIALYTYIYLYYSVKEMILNFKNYTELFLRSTIGL